MATKWCDLATRLELMKSLALAMEDRLPDASDCRAKEFIDLFYLMVEQIEMANEQAEEADKPDPVCDVVFAMNKVEDMKEEIERLKVELEQEKQKSEPIKVRVQVQEVEKPEVQHIKVQVEDKEDPPRKIFVGVEK